MNMRIMALLALGLTGMQLSAVQTGTIGQAIGKAFAAAKAESAAQNNAENKIMEAVESYKNDHDMGRFETNVQRALAESGVTFKDLFKARKDNPLHSAIVLGDEKLFDYLLEKGLDVNSLSARGWSPLREAIDKGRKEMVRKLLNSKDIDVCPMELESKAGGIIAKADLVVDESEYKLIKQSLAEFAKVKADNLKDLSLKPEAKSIEALIEKAQKNASQCTIL